MTTEGEPGGVPAPIDPEALLDQDDHATHDSQLQDYTGPGYKPGEGSRSQMAHVESSGTLMDTSFTRDETPSQHIERVRKQLDVINRFFHNRDMQKIQRQHVIKLAKSLFDYQYQDMQHVLLLGMDVQKKRRFVQYLEATKEIQDKIQRQSANAQLVMIETMFDMRLEAFRTKKERDQIIRAAFSAGDMDKAQFERALIDNEAIIADHERRLNETMGKLIERHSQFLEETLALFKTDLINRGEI